MVEWGIILANHLSLCLQWGTILSFRPRNYDHASTKYPLAVGSQFLHPNSYELTPAECLDADNDGMPSESLPGAP